MSDRIEDQHEAASLTILTIGYRARCGLPAACSPHLCEMPTAKAAGSSKHSASDFRVLLTPQQSN
jgi:hypothetical protein